MISFLTFHTQKKIGTSLFKLVHAYMSDGKNAFISKNLLKKNEVQRHYIMGQNSNSVQKKYKLRIQKTISLNLYLDKGFGEKNGKARGFNRPGLLDHGSFSFSFSFLPPNY